MTTTSSPPASTDYATGQLRLPRVEVVDCTLRDGEQAAGVEFSVERKVALAHQLAAAGIDILDAGFPAASAADFDAIQEMRRQGVGCRVGATARALTGDVVRAAESGADDVFVFMPTSNLRIRETMGIDRARAEAMLLEAGETAMSCGLALSIVFEDATRADPEWMAELLARLMDRLVVGRAFLADTVGCGDPESINRLFATLSRRLGDDIALATHCHNDLGMATANTVAAVRGGARTISCTVNGIGERAGNADLAESVAALTHLQVAEVGVRPLTLPALSEAVQHLSGIHMSPMKPVTGSNVYRHESGVHVDAMLKDRRSYEFLAPSWTAQEHEWVLGKHSGEALVRTLLAQNGCPTDDDTVRTLLAVVKEQLSMRDAELLDAGYRAKIAFERAALSGVPVSSLLATARAGGPMPS